MCLKIIFCEPLKNNYWQSIGKGRWSSLGSDSDHTHLSDNAEQICAEGGLVYLSMVTADPPTPPPPPLCLPAPWGLVEDLKANHNQIIAVRI